MTLRYLCVLTMLLPSAVTAAAKLAPNGDFTQGRDAPEGWQLSGGAGRWVDHSILEVTGNGKDSNHWSCEVTLAPGGVYRFQMRARGAAGSGCVVSGLSTANHDWRLSDAWADYEFIFRVPDGVTRDRLRIGQWEANGTFQFDRVRLTRVVPIDSHTGREALGLGETIRKGRYAFQANPGGPGGNSQRTLRRATAQFNSNRWCFGGKQEVVWQFLLAGTSLREAKARWNVCYYQRGGCELSASPDGKTWTPLKTQSKLGGAEAEVPKELLAAEGLWLRLCGATDDSGFQVDDFALDGALAMQLPDAVGRTLLAGVEGDAQPWPFLAATFQDDRGNSRAAVRFLLDGQPKSDWQGKADGSEAIAATRETGGPCTLNLSIPDAAVKDGLATVQLSRTGQSLALSVPLAVHPYYRTDYGRRLAASSDAADVWWCEAGWKVPRDRSAPVEGSPAAELSAARNEREAVQIVLRPKHELTALHAACSALKGPEGTTIDAGNIRVLRVAYHFVGRPTDATGISDNWPDALPPLAEPMNLAAGKNQPLWVSVCVPKDAAPGDYTGELTVTAKDYEARVPLRLHVWGFTLPDENHIDTALGLASHTIFQYHQLKTEADKRRVFEMYLQAMSELRLSPYDLTPLDPIGVKFLTEADPPRAELDFTRFDAEMDRVLKKFHFTNFMLPLQGMGGGTFQFRAEPSIGKYGEETPQYQQAFGSYLRQMESHLKEKGWLRKTYTYWFDEPEPKDFAFVRKGMERIKKYAPHLPNMLTEEPGDALAGPIDIWCPVTENYNHAAASQRRSAGERIWWYVCCGPKAPYCTLFIDHPATELRTWLWQSWQRDVTGILVWSTNYWTSDTAFPDRPQNPYEDPMGYVSDGALPKGTQQFWGNGDGRFLYPPEKAAAPGIAGADPVIAPPVTSIRGEMLREGIEDYEYLFLLQELLKKHRTKLGPEEAAQIEKLLQTPEQITKGMTEFTTDPRPILVRRAAIAAMIERLGR